MTEEQYSYIEELRRSSAMTHQQIADRSGIAPGTVSRIFASHPKDPGFATIASIVLAIGGSLDTLMGVEKPTIINEVNTTINEVDDACKELPAAYNTAITTSRDAFTHAYNCIQAQHEIELKRVKEYLKIKDRWLCAMFAYCVVLTVAVLFIARG